MNQITLKIYPKTSDKPHTYHSIKTKRIYYRATHEDFSKAYLRVAYTPEETNQGIYSNRQELLQALDAFLEVSNG